MFNRFISWRVLRRNPSQPHEWRPACTSPMFAKSWLGITPQTSSSWGANSAHELGCAVRRWEEPQRPHVEHAGIGLATVGAGAGRR